MSHDPKLIVITGGPGAGKTALLELARKHFCEHIAVLPEAASILFGGGFWRHESVVGQKASQRAIYHVQKELEQIVLGEKMVAIGLCDRGTIDGLAYWPGKEEEYWADLKTNIDAELARYVAVIHLRTPSLEHGYNHQNPVRTESAEKAALIDQKIWKVWEKHPRRFSVESSEAFLPKVAKAIEFIRQELPECCKSHQISGL